MTIDELRARLRACHARIGGEGRFSFTLAQQPDEECYVTHWIRPRNGVFEDCKAVGSGSVEDCLAALDRYVETYRRRPTNEEVALILGIDPPTPPAGPFDVAAE